MSRTIISIILLASMFDYRCASRSHRSESPLVIEGVVERIGANPGVGSGFHVIYQLVKYRVNSVCSGEFDQKEIVVDHLLMSGDELKSLRVGDKVYLTLSRSKEIELRSDEEGFRDASEKIETFYIGDKPQITSEKCKVCEPCP